MMGKAEWVHALWRAASLRGELEALRRESDAGPEAGG